MAMSALRNAYARRAGRLSVGGVANGLFTVGAAYDSYNTSREQGSGVIHSSLTALGEAAVPFMMGVPAYLAMSAVSVVGPAAVSVAESASRYSRDLQRMNRNKPFQSTPTFVDTQQAYTMRQAGMQLAENSKYYTQMSLLGNEAQMISR